MIRFLKTLAYPLVPDSGDVFAYLHGVTDQSLDPPSLHPGELVLQEPILFHSPLRRVTDALQLSDQQERIALQELKEIPFSLRSLCIQEEWQKERSVAVRRRFKEAFIADKLLLTRSEIEYQIQTLLQRVASYSSAAVISHSFRLKLIEAYIKTHGQVFRCPELIGEWIYDDQKTYDWGQGFEIDSKEITG